jgi:hypothetical protein
MQVAPRSGEAARRHTERTPERPRERFRRAIAGVEAGVRDARRARQLPRGPLEEQAPAEGPGRFAQAGGQETIEMKPAHMGASGNRMPIELLVEAVEHQVEQLAEAIVGNAFHAWHGQGLRCRPLDRTCGLGELRIDAALRRTVTCSWYRAGRRRRERRGRRRSWRHR